MKIKKYILGKERVFELEDAIAKALLETNNEKLISSYLEMICKEQRLERKETRRHQSLELSTNSGHEFADSNIDIIKNFEGQESVEEVLSCLTAEQKIIAKKLYIEGYTQKEVAQEMDIAKSSMCERVERIKAKIKKFLKNNS